MDDDSYDEPLTGQQLREAIEWDHTEPGIQQKLDHRRDQLARLAALHAPAVILENQVRMIRETENELLQRGPGAI